MLGTRPESFPEDASLRVPLFGDFSKRTSIFVVYGQVGGVPSPKNMFALAEHEYCDLQESHCCFTLRLQNVISLCRHKQYIVSFLKGPNPPPSGNNVNGDKFVNNGEVVKR